MTLLHEKNNNSNFDVVIFMTPEAPKNDSGGRKIILTDMLILISIMGKENIYYIGPEKPSDIEGLCLEQDHRVVTNIKKMLRLRTTAFASEYKKICFFLSCIAEEMKDKRILFFIEHTRLGFLAPMIKRIFPDRSIIIFNAHNVEFDYMRQDSQHPLKWVSAYHAEKLAHHFADVIYVPSLQDLRRHKLLYKNGKANVKLLTFALPRYSGVKNELFLKNKKELTAIFPGQLSIKHNAEAAIMILDIIAPRIQQIGRNIKFILIGGSPHSKILKHAHCDNTIIVSNPNDNIIDSSFLESDILIAPIRRGSGVNIKIMDAMCYGLAVIGTKIALRGFEPYDSFALIAEDFSKFVEMLIYLDDNREILYRYRTASIQEFQKRYTLIHRLRKMLIDLSEL